ncbi:response regulator [Desulfococcaceae bacterium HSG8]|nr:response regulator [Desulfococcaceae bacterium HSG8]
MESHEIKRIDRITEIVHNLLKGKTPNPIPCEDDPEDEIRQLTEKVNTLALDFKEIKEFIVPLSQGDLKAQLPKRNILASPFKQLQSSLSHLTWQTRQIARGDYNQRVDFMGDFSQSFNSMTEALKEARSQLLSETERFKSLADLKTHYLNVMAHDIRTPVGAVIGFADILLEGNLDDDEKKHVQIIKRSCESLIALIDNILDMAKLEKHRMELVSVPFSARILGQDAGAMIQPKLSRQTQFVFYADDQIPEKIIGDPHRLQQVLINLLGNAAKFTDNGTITLGMQLRNQDDDTDVKLYFSVEDTGIGIEKDKLEKIFTPFAQADGSIASRFGGTGLGLAISRELVTLMGGTLEVISQPGTGTTFCFTLPFRIPDESEAGIPCSDFRPCSNISNILVVDDDPNALKIISNMLTRYGVRFTLCQDSTCAYDMLIRAYEEKDSFTLAWIDIDMPKLNGLELAEKIRSDICLNQLRLVACTSYSERISDSGSPSHFSFIAKKPVSPDALQRILKEAGGSGDSSADDADELSGISLLLVDDNPINRFLVTNMLQKLDVRITEAEDGSEAVERVSGNTFDLVMMDKMMPVMDGTEAIRRIREIYDSSTLPIMAFTANDFEADTRELLTAGANGVIFKPIVYEDMISSLCEAIRVKRDT